jgi:hypothetical protein
MHTPHQNGHSPPNRLPGLDSGPERDECRGLARDGILAALRALSDKAADPLEALNRVASLRDDLAAERKSPVRLLDSREFDDARYEVEYLIDGLIVRGQPGTIAAPMKTGKTLVAIALAVAGARGVPPFGFERFRVARPFRTALWSMESGGGAIQAVARSQCHALGCRLSDLGDMVHWGLDALTLSDPPTAAALRREVERKGIECLIVDPLYRAVGIAEGEDSSIYRMGALLDSLAKVAADTGLTLLLVHHSVKRRENPFAPMQLHELNGAGIGEFVRQWVLLSRRVPYDGEKPGHHELWVTAGGSAGHSGSYALDIDEFSDAGFRRDWRASLVSASEAAADLKQTQHARKQADREADAEAFRTEAVKRYAPKVIAYLRRKENREGASASAVRNGCGIAPKAWGIVLPYLLDSGQVTDCRYRGGNGKTFLGYRLPDEQQDSAGLQPDSPGESGSVGAQSTQQDSSPLGGNPSVSALDRPKRKRTTKAKGSG